MNSAYFMVFSGTMVQCTCGPETILSAVSSGSFDCESSIHSAAAARGFLATISVASLSAATKALYSCGFASRNLAEVQIAVKVCEPPITSKELSTVCTLLSSSCWYWNGGTLNAAVICAPPLSNATVASGGVIDTVSGSSFSNSFSPNALDAAICSVRACTDDFTAGTAMRSLSLKSLMVLILGSRVLSRNGCELSAEMPRTSCGVPLVRAHNVSRPGTPPDPIST